MMNRLAWFHLAKVLSHNSALYRTHTRQDKSVAVLSRVVGSLRPFTHAQWRAWCASRPLTPCSRAERAKEKAIATAQPMQDGDAAEVLKRPAGVEARTSTKRPAAHVPVPPPKLVRSLSDHRTVFQIERPTRL